MDRAPGRGERFDAIGEDDPGRLAGLGDAALATAPDDALQSIVARAAAQLHAPVATITLVLRRLQLTRAHVGLDANAAEVPAIDRCASFCQVVVRDRAPLLIRDARTDPRVPRQVVDALGIVAYLGTPLSLGGEVVGSLCVIDTVPHDFSVADRDALQALGREAIARLDQLSPDAPAKHMANPQIAADIALARVAAAEARMHVRLLQAAGTEDARRALMRDGGLALDDLDAALARLERELYSR